MSIIKPFRGYTPAKEYAKLVASLPYDVLNTEEAKIEAEGNPYTFLRVEKSELEFPEETDVHSEQVYKRGADNFQKLVKQKIFIRNDKPTLYVYRQKMGNLVQTGLVAGASIDEYDKNIIKKHELTRKDKEDDRVKHIDAVNANTGPVFLTYRHQDKINTIISEITSKIPDIDFVAVDGIQHVLWIIKSDEQVNKLVKYFNEIPALYVADGHHRSAAASRVRALRKAANPNHTGNEEYNFFLSVIFPDNQLTIMDYNRVLKDLNGLTSSEFMNKIKEKFDVKKLNVSSPEEAKPVKRADFSMYLDKQWYNLTPKLGVVPKNDPVNSLDVSILQNYVLNPILGIIDPRTSQRIDFVGGIRGLKELVKRCEKDCKLAFALYPTGMDQLMGIADAGMIMPPKSTWFEPKLRSGVVVRPLA